MKDILVATILKTYDRSSFLASINGVDEWHNEQYKPEEIVIFGIDLDDPFSTRIHLIGQHVLLIAEGRDEFGRVKARYKWLQSQ